MVVEEINYPICSPMYSNDYDECSHCIIKDLETCFWRETNTIGIFNFLQIIRKKKEKQFDGRAMVENHPPLNCERP